MRNSMKSAFFVALVAMNAFLASNATVTTDNDLICDSDLRIAKLSVTGSDSDGEVTTGQFRTGTLTADSIQASTVIISTLDISSINPSSTDGTIQVGKNELSWQNPYILFSWLVSSTLKA